MTAPTPTLTEFLHARYDEREAVAKAALPGPWEVDASAAVLDEPTVIQADSRRGRAVVEVALGCQEATGFSDVAHIALNDPARVLAECEAKRRIVALHHPSGEYNHDACVLCQWDIDCDSPRADYHDGAGEFPCDTLRLLALPYADHPDYRQEWKP